MIIRVDLQGRVQQFQSLLALAFFQQDPPQIAERHRPHRIGLQRQPQQSLPFSELAEFTPQNQAQQVAGFAIYRPMVCQGTQKGQRGFIFSPAMVPSSQRVCGAGMACVGLQKLTIRNRLL